MLRARRELTGAAVNYKALVVITDGLDNRFAQDVEFNPDGLSIPEKLRQEFTGSGIVVSVIGFRVAKANLKSSQAQFAVAEQLDPPGHFVTADDTAALAAELRKALRQ